MDQIFSQFQIITLRDIPRRLGYHLPVARIGFLPKKRQWVDGSTKDVHCFSMIIGGSGTYVAGDKSIPIKAPCMLTPRALGEVKYGPDDSWRELFFFYDPVYLHELCSHGYVDPDRPVWRLGNLSRIQNVLNDLCLSMQAINVPGNADRIDQLCETLLRESILSHTDVDRGPEYEGMLWAKHYVGTHYLTDPDTTSLAKKVKMTEPTFRRHWARLFGSSPKQYAIELRMNEACRRLMETDMQIGEISQKIGFDDTHYFCRFFKKKIGKTPTEYRKACRSI